MTKKQREKIYNGLAQILIDNPEECMCVCVRLGDKLGGYSRITILTLKETFKEFYMFQPEEECGAWWPTHGDYGNLPRSIALLLSAEMTRDEK